MYCKYYLYRSLSKETHNKNLDVLSTTNVVRTVSNFYRNKIKKFNFISKKYL